MAKFLKLGNFRRWSHSLCRMTAMATTKCNRRYRCYDCSPALAKTEDDDMFEVTGAVCVFRDDPSTDSDLMRPSIREHSGTTARQARRQAHGDPHGRTRPRRVVVPASTGSSAQILEICLALIHLAEQERRAISFCCNGSMSLSCTRPWVAS